jgi:hypothetical protein
MWGTGAALCEPVPIGARGVRARIHSISSTVRGPSELSVHSLPVRGEEAVLVTGFPFTVRFFNTRFRPDEFPLVMLILAVLTGLAAGMATR